AETTSRAKQRLLVFGPDTARTASSSTRTLFLSGHENQEKTAAAEEVANIDHIQEVGQADNHNELHMLAATPSISSELKSKSRLLLRNSGGTKPALEDEDAEVSDGASTSAAERRLFVRDEIETNRNSSRAARTNSGTRAMAATSPAGTGLSQQARMFSSTTSSPGTPKTPEGDEDPEEDQNGSSNNTHNFAMLKATTARPRDEPRPTLKNDTRKDMIRKVIEQLGGSRATVREVEQQLGKKFKLHKHTEIKQILGKRLQAFIRYDFEEQPVTEEDREKVASLVEQFSKHCEEQNKHGRSAVHIDIDSTDFLNLFKNADLAVYLERNGYNRWVAEKA
ncbi:unnamed protein product, partial [Amoebophrya sp. A120]